MQAKYGLKPDVMPLGSWMLTYSLKRELFNQAKKTVYIYPQFPGQLTLSSPSQMC